MPVSTPGAFMVISDDNPGTLKVPQDDVFPFADQDLLDKEHYFLSVQVITPELMPGRKNRLY